MSEYFDLGGDWFDRAVAFLDAPLPDLRAKAKPRPAVGKPVAPPVSPPVRPAPGR